MTTSIGFDIFAKDRASSTFKHVGSSASESEGHLSRLKGTLLKVGAGFAAFEGARKAVEFLKSSTEAASEDQAAQRKLALALKNTTGANKEQISGTQEWITKQSEALGISKDEIMPAFERLAESTGSVTKAQKEMKVAFDVSAGTGKNLNVVSMALMKANNGTTASLSRLGLKTKTTAADTVGLQAAHLAVTQAQEALTAATKKYGPNTDQANAAVVKLHQSQQKLHDTLTKGKTTTLTLDQAMHKMSDTFGGQAKAKAHSFDGTMQRLSTTWHEAKVQVGNQLIPVLQKLANWVLGKGIPAVKSFAAQFRAGTGDAGKIRTVLVLLGHVVGDLGGFLMRHKAIMVGVIAAWAAWRTAVLVNNTVMAISLIRLKMQTVGTVENAIASKVAAGAQKAWAAAQWLLNAAMDANPIGLVVLAVAALVVGMVIAYKKSATFRAIVQGAFHGILAASKAVASFFTSKIPAAFQAVMSAAGKTIGWVKSNWPLLLAILTGPIGLAVLAISKNWDKIKSGAQNALHAVTGFFTSLPGKIKGALGNLGGLLLGAGKAVVQGLIDGIGSMVGALTSKLHSITKLIPIHKGPIDKDRILLKPAGVAIMEGLIAGIESKRVAVQTVLDKVTAAVQAAGAKLQAAVQQRNSFASGFQGFSTSVFGNSSTTDANGNPVAPTAASVIAFQKQQAAQAHMVKADVRKLIKMGLSPALIKQLQAQGAAGIPEIEALAHGSQAQIRQLNALNRQTTGDLQSAGMTAANRIYGDQIKQDRQHYSEEKRLLSEIRDLLKHEHGKNLTFTIHGRDLVAIQNKEKRVTGVKPS